MEVGLEERVTGDKGRSIFTTVKFNRGDFLCEYAGTRIEKGSRPRNVPSIVDPQLPPELKDLNALERWVELQPVSKEQHLFAGGTLMMLCTRSALQRRDCLLNLEFLRS